MIERLTRCCKRCAAEFQQPRLNVRPYEYCSLKCQDLSRRQSKALRCRERYALLRREGIPPLDARRASQGGHKFQAAMAAAQQGELA